MLMWGETFSFSWLNCSSQGLESSLISIYVKILWEAGGERAAVAQLNDGGSDYSVPVKGEGGSFFE